jgi:hypothetical protein
VFLNSYDCSLKAGLVRAGVTAPATVSYCHRLRCLASQVVVATRRYTRPTMYLVSDEFSPVFHGFALAFVSANPPISKLIRFV